VPVPSPRIRPSPLAIACAAAVGVTFGGLTALSCAGSPTVAASGLRAPPPPAAAQPSPPCKAGLLPGIVIPPSADLRAQLGAAEASLHEANAHAERAARALLGARHRLERVARGTYVPREERTAARRDEQQAGADLEVARALVSERTANVDRLWNMLTAGRN
jgi:hypothetical protein